MTLKYFLAKVGEYAAKIGDYAAMVAKEVPFELKAIAQDFYGLDNYYPSDQGRYNYIKWSDTGSLVTTYSGISYTAYNVLTLSTETISQTYCGCMVGEKTITFHSTEKFKLRNYLRARNEGDELVLKDSSGTIINTYTLTDSNNVLEFEEVLDAGDYTLSIASGTPYWHGSNLVSEDDTPEPQLLGEFWITSMDGTPGSTPANVFTNYGSYKTLTVGGGIIIQTSEGPVTTAFGWKLNSAGKIAYELSGEAKMMIVTRTAQQYKAAPAVSTGTLLSEETEDQLTTYIYSVTDSGDITRGYRSSENSPIVYIKLYTE